MKASNSHMKKHGSVTTIKINSQKSISPSKERTAVNTGKSRDGGFSLETRHTKPPNGETK